MSPTRRRRGVRATSLAFVLVILAASGLAACGEETAGEGDPSGSPTSEPAPSDPVTSEAAPDYGEVPAGSTSDHGLVYSPEDIGASSSDDTREILIWTDLGCPSCQALFEQYEDDLASGVAAGDLSLEIRFATITDDQSARPYASLAASLAACTYNTDGPEAFWTVLNALYDQQPARGAPAPEDDELIGVAEGAGASTGVAQCYADAPFAGWVDSSNALFLSEAHAGTPTVIIDGDVLGDPGSELGRALDD